MIASIRRLACLSLLALASCTQKSTTPVTFAPTRPFLEIQPSAVSALRTIAQTQKLGSVWWVRLEVTWKPTAKIEVNIEKQQPGPKDYTLVADGLDCVVASVQKPYLKGAYIELVRAGKEIRFDVTFPNRNERDRALASEWLRTEESRRDAESSK